MTNMVDTHVRFEQDAYKTILEIADENSVSMSGLVRMAVGFNLQRYLSNVQYLSVAQGEEILRAINNLSYETAKLKIELNRIGVNLNQTVKQLHGSSVLEKVQIEQEIKALQSQMKEIMQLFDATTIREGEMLWHIQK